MDQYNPQFSAQQIDPNAKWFTPNFVSGEVNQVYEEFSPKVSSIEDKIRINIFALTIYCYLESKEYIDAKLAELAEQIATLDDLKKKDDFYLLIVDAFAKTHEITKAKNIIQYITEPETIAKAIESIMSGYYSVFSLNGQRKQYNRQASCVAPR